MERKEQLLKLIPEQGILPLYFYKDTEVSLNVLKALYAAGIRAVEYTNSKRHSRSLPVLLLQFRLQ